MSIGRGPYNNVVLTTLLTAGRWHDVIVEATINTVVVRCSRDMYTEDGVRCEPGYGYRLYHQKFRVPYAVAKPDKPGYMVSMEEVSEIYMKEIATILLPLMLNRDMYGKLKW